MDDKTNLTPEQDEVQTGEEVSFTISGEDAAAQEALNAKKTAKKKSPLPWMRVSSVTACSAADSSSAAVTASLPKVWRKPFATSAASVGSACVKPIARSSAL